MPVICTLTGIEEVFHPHVFSFVWPHAICCITCDKLDLGVCITSSCMQHGMRIVQVAPASAKAPSEKDILLDKLRDMEVRPSTIRSGTSKSEWGL